MDLLAPKGAYRVDIERFGEHDILLTFQEAAELLRVSRATMYRLLSSGQLEGHRVGRGWRFYKMDVHRFVASQSAQHSPKTTMLVAGDPGASTP